MFSPRNYVRAASVTGFSLLLLAAALSPADASDAPVNGSDASLVTSAAPAELAPAPVTLTLTFDGRESTYTTEAKTFGDFLTEIGFHPGPGDFLSPDASAVLTDGMRAEFRAAVPLTIISGRRKVSLHTSAPTLEDAIASAHIAIGPRDTIFPDRRSLPIEDEVVHVTRVDVWTQTLHRTIAQPVIRRFDARLARGTSRVVSPGVSELREITVRFSRRGDATTQTKILGSRVVRKARPEIIARGTRPLMPIASVAQPSPISRFASSGISSAMHFAGNVLHVIATAYIAGCYKCSGITANGMHAGFGIIAVDPHLIPLGTKLLIPGYGRAIAGDTGGAIVGHRVDLGMNTLADAIRFGRRPMTVYVLK